MKLAILGLAVALVLGYVGILYAGTHTVTEVTLGWNPVTTLADGSAVPADQVSFEVFVADLARQNQVAVGRTTQNSFHIVFQGEGKFIVGCRTVRTVDGEEVAYSEMSWSDMADRCENGETFDFRVYQKPSFPQGLKRILAILR
jgi:hypothetical protein